jgi:hypothetical protein
VLCNFAMYCGWHRNGEEQSHVGFCVPERLLLKENQCNVWNGVKVVGSLYFLNGHGPGASYS